MKTVFFLDDDSDFLEVMKLFVELNSKCSVQTATSYDETIGLSDTVLKSDLIFLDINLGPRSPSGLDVFRWLRKNGYVRKIYFLTGHARHAPEVREAEACDDAVVLSKPFPYKDLLTLIQSGS